MRNSTLILLFGICIFTFQQTLALRRIKRGSTATQNKTKLTNDILTDMHNISNDIKLGEKVAGIGTDGHHPEVKEHTEGTWAKKAVAAVEHAIDKAFSSLSHKNDEEKSKKDVQPNHLPLHYTSNNVPLHSADSANVAVNGKDLYKSSLAYMLDNRHNAERLFGNMQNDGEFGAGDGPAEVVIIDNAMQPMMGGVQQGMNSFTFHQPNLRNIANSFKRLAELSKESKLNNLNVGKVNADNSNNNANQHNNNLVGKQSNDNGISEGHAENQKDPMLKNNKRNDKHNNGHSKINENLTVGSSHKRNNEHSATSANKDDNSQLKYNSNNNNHNSNNNDALIDGKNQLNSCLQQEQQQQQQQQYGEHSEMRETYPALLSLARKTMNGFGESSKLHEESPQTHEQQQQLRMKHDNEKVAEAGQQSTHTQTQAEALALGEQPRQQQMQFIKHTNGKIMPMESFLKFANMMMYKVGPDGTPIHAQGAQLAVNGNPTTSVISFSPMDGPEDAETIDYIYNTLDPQMNLLHNPASPIAAPLAPPLIGPGNTAMISRPFILPPYNLAGPSQPFNFIENALDMILSAEDEGGNDGVELYCPIHHPKKKSSDSAADGKDKDGVIQVCSCRFIKKNKIA